MNLLELPKQIDAIIDGLIRFVYGVGSAFVCLAVRPVTTAVWIASSARSISGSTLLFVGCLPLPLLVIALSGERTFSYGDMANLIAGEGFDGIGPYLLQLALLYFLADGTCALLTFALVERGRRRRRALQMVRSGMASLVLNTTVTLFALVTVIQALPSDLGFATALVLGPYLPLLCLPAVVPLVLVVHAVASARLPAAKWARRMTFVSSTAVALAVGGFLLPLGFGVVQQWASQALAKTGRFINTEVLQCHLPLQGNVDVNLVLHNRTGQPVAFKTAKQSIHFRNHAGKHLGYVLVRPAQEGVTIIKAGDMAAFGYVSEGDVGELAWRQDAWTCEMNTWVLGEHRVVDGGPWYADRDRLAEGAR